MAGEEEEEETYKWAEVSMGSVWETIILPLTLNPSPPFKAQL